MFGLFLKFVLWQAIAWVLTPKPKAPKAATIDELNIPRTTEGDEIGIGFGTYLRKSPQVAWFGDMKTKAIKDSGGKK